MMMRMMVFAALVAAIGGGCISAKSRQISAAGMYTDAKSGALVIGTADVRAVMPGESALMATYSEDTAWLSPATKTHSFEVVICGTNAPPHYEAVIARLCAAVATTASIDAGGASNAVQAVQSPDGGGADSAAAE